MEDERIIELFFERSENAIAELDGKYGKLCHQVSYHILHNTEDASECVNDAYYGIWNKIPPQRPKPLRAYLLKIVKNLSLKRLHYHQAQKRGGVWEYELSIEELEECVTDGNTVESEIELKALTEAIEVFLREIKYEDRTMFVKRYWLLCPVKDIAVEYGVSERNAAMRLSRIRKKLKKFLGERGIVV